MRRALGSVWMPFRRSELEAVVDVPMKIWSAFVATNALFVYIFGLRLDVICM